MNIHYATSNFYQGQLIIWHMIYPPLRTKVDLGLRFSDDPSKFSEFMIL